METIPVEFAVTLSPVQERVRAKLAMAGLDAELTLEEFAAYRGVEVGQVRDNLHRTRGVCRTSQKAVGIHLRTYLMENIAANDCRPRRRKV